MLPAFVRRARMLLAAALVLLAPFAAADATPATTGEQKTAVILVNFQDRATQPISVDAAHALVFGRVSDFYWEASYQKTFLSGATFGWFTLPVSSASCDVGLIAREADKAATAAGVDLAAYDRLIYLAPQNACSVAGYNNGPGVWPSRTWLITDRVDARLVAHELGHNFGLSHSMATDCGSAALGGSCTTYSYGDLADTMGSGDTPHFNAFQKETLGWLDASGQPPITHVAASGRYVLAPLETAGTGARALRIPRGIDPASGQMNYYYVEYRQPVGFDAGLGATGNLARGVLVHTGGPSAPDGVQQQSLLLDMTPGSYASASDDFVDSALVVGATYADSAAGISLRVVSADTTGATVDVVVGDAGAPACTRTSPALQVAGPGTAVAAGTSVVYTVTLTNRDSSGCAATAFALAGSLPAGWAGALAATSLSLSPGASGSTSLSVASPAGTPAGNYAIGVGSSSAAGSVHTTSASAVYAVAGSGALSDTVATDKPGYARGELVYFSALVKRDGTPVGGAGVTFTLVSPGGARTTLAATTGADGHARGSYRLGKSKSAVGGWTLRADASSGMDTASAGTSFSVR